MANTFRCNFGKHRDLSVTPIVMYVNDESISL